MFLLTKKDSSECIHIIVTFMSFSGIDIYAGTEKKNDEAKKNFFKSSNKWDAAKDILKYEYQLNVLRYFEREKQNYRFVEW